MKPTLLILAVLISLGCVGSSLGATKQETVNGFTISVTATLTAPASGVHHTGGGDSMTVNFGSSIAGSVAADGSYGSATAWFFTATLWNNVNTNIAGATGTNPVDPQVIAANDATTIHWSQIGSPTLTGSLTVNEGGNTAHADMQCWTTTFTSLDLPVYADDPVNYTVVDP